MIHENLGQQQGLTTAFEYISLLYGYGRVMEAKDDG
jgi:hypothetical protein